MCENTYDEALAAERFIAFVEIIAALILAEDITLPPHDVHVLLSVTCDEPHVERHPDSGGSEHWAVAVLARTDGTNAPEEATVAESTAAQVMALMLAEADLAVERADGALRRVAERMAAYTVPGGLYDRFLARLVPRDRWEGSRREASHPLG
jgi:hypothetical protein